VLQDQLAGVQRGGETDLALLTDGLSAEREQGITIDVAYRYFSTAKRKFIIGDAPGHEQYTRNMVTAASAADAAVVLVDATKLAWAAEVEDGTVVKRELLPQTRRHTLLATCCACSRSCSRSTSSTPSTMPAWPSNASRPR
jgi:sulfate adenylyltransferase subunit 1